MKKTAPITLFVYNRPEHTKKIVEALQKNFLAKESDLFIFSDRAKNEESKDKVKEVRDYIKTISGFKKVEIIERSENFGIAKSIISGVTEIVNEYGKIIVLEDDIVTSPYFLEYMNEALYLYESEEKVISIHGYNYPIKNKLPETFFIKGADCWGWATWKRGWDLFESDGKKLLSELEQKKLTKEFDFNGTYKFTQMLRDQIAGKNNSWAIRWYASAFLANKLTLYPGETLVQNIGMDGSGTHCGTVNNFNKTSQTKNIKIKIEKIEIKENKKTRTEFEQFFKTLTKKPNILKRILRKIKQTTKNQIYKYPKFFKPFFSFIFEIETSISKKWVSSSHRRLFNVTWNIPNNPEYFDHSIDLFYQWQKTRASFWLERGVFSSLALKRNGNVLELACGDGFNARNFYSGLVNNIIACDFDESAIIVARKKNNAPNLKFVLADIRTNMPEGIYDNITWDAAIEHFNPEEISNILSNIKKRLKPDGILSGYTIVEKESGKSLKQHEYEFKSMSDLKRFFMPLFKNVIVFETIFPQRHNLYFYASDSVLPFSNKWKHWLNSENENKKNSIKK